MALGRVGVAQDLCCAGKPRALTSSKDSGKWNVPGLVAWRESLVGGSTLPDAEARSDRKKSQQCLKSDKHDDQ